MKRKGPTGLSKDRPVRVSAEWNARLPGRLRDACSAFIDEAKQDGTQTRQRVLYVYPASTISGLAIDKKIRNAFTSRKLISAVCFVMEPNRRRASTQKADVIHSVVLDVPRSRRLSPINRVMQHVGAKPLWCRPASFGQRVKFRLSRRSLSRLVNVMSTARPLAGIRVHLGIGVMSVRHRTIHVPWLREYGSPGFCGRMYMSIYRVA